MTRRLATTLALAILFLVAAELVPLPSVDPEAMGLTFGHRHMAGVLAVGLTPVISAYVIVEVIAFLVPRWSRLRHDNPKGRARLDRAVMIVAVVLAAIQGCGMSLTLESAPMMGAVKSSGWEFRGLVTATILGGVMTSVVVARIITAQRIVNGFVVLLAATEARDVLLATGHRIQPSFNDISVALAAGVVVVYATLRCIAAARAPAVTTVQRDADPYRTVQSMLVHPVIPVPTGSIQPYLASIWLLFALPALLHGMNVPTFSLPANPFVQVALVVVVASILNVAFGRAMHRPKELRKLAKRVGAKIGSEAGLAIRRTYMPSVLFFFTLAVADRAFGAVTGTTLVALPLVVAAVHDGWGAWRDGRGDRTWVVVWEDRRVTAAHAIRAVLECHGIEARMEGFAFLWLLQAFAPFAPARIVVPEDMRARAESVLERLLPNGEPPRIDSAPLREPPAFPERADIVRVLGLCALAAAIIMAVAQPSTEQGATPRSTELAR